MTKVNTKVKKVSKKCKNCKKEFIAYPHYKFCSNECRFAHFHSQAITNIPTGTIGALAELMVSCELMRVGYEVFRAMSPSSDSDLIAIKDNTIYKIEVRTGRYSDVGKIHYPKNKTDGKHVIVVTHSDQKIHFINTLGIGHSE